MKRFTGAGAIPQRTEFARIGIGPCRFMCKANMQGGWTLSGKQRDELFESSHVYAEFVGELEKALAMIAANTARAPHGHAPVLRSRAVEKATI